VLRITKEADYAIMLLAFLAERPAGEIHTARQAADWSGLPLPMVSKILRTLAREGVLTSHRGVTGGYSLDRPGSDMTVAAVIRALEGPIAIVQCGAEPGACEQERLCPTRRNWERISREVERALDRIPITEMSSRPRAELLRVGGRGPGAAARGESAGENS
jgi:FeS assembly SUF system regulator